MEEDFIVHIRIPRAFVLDPRVLDPHCHELLRTEPLSQCDCVLREQIGADTCDGKFLNCSGKTMVEDVKNSFDNSNIRLQRLRQ